MRDKTIVGFGYKQGVGKDTAAELLCKQHTFINVKYADKLKELCASLFGWPRDMLEDPTFKETEDNFWSITPRLAMQLVGTDAMRNNLRNDIWVKSLELKIQQGRANTCFVITDVRFPNEADAIHEWGGKVFRIDRPDYTGGVHASETALDGYNKWDGVIDNFGSISDLHTAVTNTLIAHKIPLPEAPIGSP